MQKLREDLTSAFRHVRQRRAAALAVVLMIAVGIGANTTVFGLLKATFDDPPFPAMDRLVVVRMTAPAQGDISQWISVPEYVVLEEENQVFEAVGGMDDNVFTHGPGDGLPADRIIGQRFKASMFDVLGVQPLLGRGFAPGEDSVGLISAPLAVISHRLWQSRFAADPHVIERTMLLDNVRTTIIGVMPPGFSLFDEVDVWIPQRFGPAQLLGSVRFLVAVARLRPGVSLEQAQTAIDRLSRALAEKFPDRNTGWEFRLEPLDTAYFGNTRQALILLQAAVALILLIACANVAGLLLVEAAARQRELAMRWALGADRGRLVRQLLTESLVLSLAGGTLGIVLAFGGVTMLTRLRPAWLARIDAVAIDGPFLFFAFGVSVLTGIAFGLAPSLQLSRVGGPRALSDITRTPAGGGRLRLQGGLVIGQVALTLVLLICAGLLIKTVIRLQTANLGADPGGVLSFESVLSRALDLKLTGDRLNGFAEFDFSPVPAREFEQVVQRLSEIPGVVSAAGIDFPPFGGLVAEVPFSIEGRAQVEREGQTAGYHLVTANFFATMRIPIRRGREFTFRDSADAPWVAVINEAMARRFWPNQDPIGQHVTLTIAPDERPRQIVGIVGDTPLNRFDQTSMPMVYVPHVQQLARHRAPYGGARLQMTFVLRLRGNPDTVLPDVRRIVAEVDPAMPISRAQMLEDQLAAQIETPRFYMVALALFSGFALLLAMFGIYGVITYTVARRAREVAIRMALGASGGTVVRLVLGQAALYVAGGVGMGVGASMLVTKYLAGVLWGVTPTDPGTFVSVALLFTIVAVSAALVPTYRALRLEPRTVLAET